MASTTSTPKYFTPNQYPVLPRRLSITPSQRPSTSGGDSVEPKSDFLREALREKKGYPPRSQSTTPRKNKQTNRPFVSQLAHDELFLPSSDDEAAFSQRRPAPRPMRTRRASEIPTTRPSPKTPARTLGMKEAESQTDKLLKENWDLKHRIMLHDQAFSKLRTELDAAMEELDRTAVLRERNQELQEAIELISRQAAVHEEENRNLKVNNADLTVLNDDLMRELEAKDDGIQQRQLAIEEAAGIIQQLEAANEKMKRQMQPLSPRPDSDYFSGDADSTPSKSMKVSLRPTTAGTCGTECTNPPDSDYFSADSPGLTPVTPKRKPQPLSQQQASQMERAKAMGAAFNREIGLRGQASKDSLLSTFLETPVPEPSQHLRRRLQQSYPAPQRGSIREELLRAGTPPWTTNRELKAIYEDGAFNHQLGLAEHLRSKGGAGGYTPSVTVASVSASPSIDNIYLLHDDQHYHYQQSTLPTLSSLATTISTSTSSSPAHHHHQIPLGRGTAPTPVNYSMWPRKLPDWPPSAGLRNRDILFHGTGMDEMFPDSPPRPSSSRDLESFSSVHLLRGANTAPGSGRERHARSSSAQPAAGAVAPAPAPPLQSGSQAPQGALGRTKSLSRQVVGMGMVVQRRMGLERSRTLPAAQ